MKRMTIKILSFVLLIGCLVTMTSCNIEDLFIFGGQAGEYKDIEHFEDQNNAIFIALYNYYGYEGQHFTNKWLGMNDALKRHGITVTGYEGQKDARKFTIVREDWCDLPEDAVIFMVNNQNWDTSIQFTKPFSNYHPMVVISTCNGVEMASSPISSSGQNISNATMGGFSDYYQNAFENGTLNYLSAKYSAHILPIVAAAVDAVDKGQAMKNADGSALSIDIISWAVQTLDQYHELSAIDTVDIEHPTLRKINIDKFFDPSNAEYGAANLVKWAEAASVENIRALYEQNGTNAAEDEAAIRTGKKLRVGLIVPGSVNDQVQKYIDYINGYLAKIYNFEVITNSTTSTNTQNLGAETLCNQGCDIIISLQDDTNRNEAIRVANSKNVYFAIVGTCQNPIDYEEVKMLPYYIGSVGTSINEERRAADEMTEYYLQCMIHREKGDLEDWQAEYKGLKG